VSYATDDKDLLWKQVLAEKEEEERNQQKQRLVALARPYAPPFLCVQPVVGEDDLDAQREQRQRLTAAAAAGGGGEVQRWRPPPRATTVPCLIASNSKVFE